MTARQNGSGTGVSRYDEYGIPGSGHVGRFGYTGQAWLPEPGMNYYKARMYSPTLGRFMQTDPIGYGDGLNWYNYVGSDPVNKIDPSGLTTVCTQGTDDDGVPNAPKVCSSSNDQSSNGWTTNVAISGFASPGGASKGLAIV